MKIREVTEIQEAPLGSKYGLKGKPEWYDRAVKMKLDNPSISAIEIARQVGVSNHNVIQYWLTGKELPGRPMLARPKDSFPFKPSDFKIGLKQGEMPEWYDRAVQMKLNNPRITATEIGNQIGVDKHTIQYWLTGESSPSRTYKDRPQTNDWPPFKSEDFPKIGPKKYYDGDKPEWYDQALQMAKAGESFTAIGKKFGVSDATIGKWLVKGKKNNSGTLVNPDAVLEPRKIRGQKLDINLLNSFIQDGYTDKEIIELVADEKGPKIASQVRDMLPVLRQKLNPGTQVLDKTRTGSMRDPDITGLIK